jgi:4-coumarate--CoA ligase
MYFYCTVYKICQTYRNATVIKTLKRAKSTVTNVIKSKSADIIVPNQLIHEYVWEHLDNWYDKTAVMCFDTGKRYTFQQIYHKSWSLAAVLRQKFQLQVGDTVAVILPNVPDFPVAFLGAIQAGLVVTTVNPFYTPDEMAVQLGDSGSQLIFTNRELLPFVNKATNKLRKRVPTVLAETKPVNCNKQQLLSSHNFYCQADSLPANCVRLDELCDTSNNNNKDKLDNLLPDDVALLPYSSGTTGLSKGVQLTHRNVVSNLYQMSSPDFVVNRKTEGTCASQLHQTVLQFQVASKT